MGSDEGDEDGTEGSHFIFCSSFHKKIFKVIKVSHYVLKDICQLYLHFIYFFCSTEIIMYVN